MKWQFTANGTCKINLLGLFNKFFFHCWAAFKCFTFVCPIPPLLAEVKGLSRACLPSSSAPHVNTTEERIKCKLNAYPIHLAKSAGHQSSHQSIYHYWAFDGQSVGQAEGSLRISHNSATNQHSFGPAIDRVVLSTITVRVGQRPSWVGDHLSTETPKPQNV